MKAVTRAKPTKGIALAIMAKVPHAGDCKTRLVPPLTYAQAAALSERFQADTAENVVAVARTTGSVAIVAYTPHATRERLRDLFGESVAFIEQRGIDFGARLFNVVRDLLAAGHAGVCLIDSDSPTLPANSLVRAVRALEKGGDRIVLGPALDGGYYLIGMKRAHDTLFTGIEWSTSRVFAQTMRKVADADLSLCLLPHWFDVDDEDGLRLLSRELLGRDKHGGFAAPATRAFLATLPQAVKYLARVAG